MATTGLFARGFLGNGTAGLFARGFLGGVAAVVGTFIPIFRRRRR